MDSNHRPHAYQACALTSWAISPSLKSFDFSGDEEIRTLDPLLARQVLSQLSYIPIWSGIHLLSHTVSSAVPSAACVLTVVFGMGTGVSPKRIATRNIIKLSVRASLVSPSNTLRFFSVEPILHIHLSVYVFHLVCKHPICHPSSQICELTHW